jgi:hypothetical protein
MMHVVLCERKWGHLEIQKGPVGVKWGQYPYSRYWPEPATRHLKTGHSILASLDNS